MEQSAVAIRAKLALVSEPGPKQVNGLAICSKNQFRDYFIRNRLEKLVPLNWNFAPQNLKNRKKQPTCFQTLTFCRNLRFQKSWICPWIFQGFPTPWIFGEAAGAADKKQKTTNTGGCSPARTSEGACQ